MQLPRRGRPVDDVIADLHAKRHGDVRWSEGRTFSLVFDGGPTVHDAAEQAARLFLHENALNTRAFPSLARIQSEVVGWTADLLHAPATAAGFLTSGGTESIQCAVLAARERGRVERGVTDAEIVVAESAHAAFHKSAHLFGMRIVTTPVRADWTADVDAMAAAITPNTVLVVGSAPQYPQGVVDPIPEIAALAATVDANCHVDACMGGFVLPFAEMLGRDVAPWDFRVAGVHSVSADIHKLGYAPKGVSVIVHRTKQLRAYQTFVFDGWLGGHYASPNLQGTRSGAPMAAAWAVMQHLGVDGYVERTAATLAAADRMRAGIATLDGIRVLGDGDLHLVALAADPAGAIDVFALGDALARRGWFHDRQAPPDSLHSTVSYANVPAIDEWLADLAASRAQLGATPPATRPATGRRATPPWSERRHDGQVAPRRHYVCAVDELRPYSVDQLIDGPPADARELIRALLVFRHLDDAALDALAATVEWLRVPAGARLFSVGDDPDGMYGLISGRVRFFAEDDGRPVMTAEAGPGITFGEGALLVGGGRSRTAVVVRDALLVRLPPAVFTTLMSSSPQVATRVAGMLAARIAFKYEPVADGSTDDTVLVGATEPAEFAWFVDALRRHAGAEVVRAADLDLARPPRTLVPVDIRDVDDVARAVRQAERVLLVTTAREPSSHLARLAPVMQPDVDPLAAAPIELVLLARSGRREPAGAWLASHVFSACHHVRRDSESDVARVARHLAGHAVGLVLGGGGARGMAHIGVIKALAELGIPIDHVGGSSIGAIVGGQVAMGWAWDEMLSYDEREWTSRWLRFDLTLPTVSVSSGRRARRILDDTFGSLAIEDFVLPFFCTTVNLSRFRLAVHRDGPAARWILASASAPGLWPPVVDEFGELHIDGGQLNNVPTDVMRVGHLGPIIAVDVCAVQSPMTVPEGVEPPVGIRHLLRRRFRHRFPSLVDTVSRCALLGSLQHRETAFEQADVYLTPDLATIGFSGFGRIREAVEIGYETAMRELADWRPA